MAYQGATSNYGQGGGYGQSQVGWFQDQAAYHNQNMGQPYAYSGYWGKPVYGSEMPAYEQAAYGFQSAPRALTGFEEKMGLGQEGSYPGGGGYGAPPAGYSGMPSSGSYSGSQSYSQSGMSDPWGYANAAANVLENMYGKMKTNKKRELDTDFARRNIFSSGAAAGLNSDAMNSLDLQKGADIAKLYQNRSDQLYSMSSSGSSGSNPSAGSPGPWNMGGFGSTLPGFLQAPGGDGRAITPSSGGNSTSGQYFGPNFGPAGFGIGQTPQW